MTAPAEESGCCQNTDRELWREREGDYYADSIHVTESGGIGINAGGLVIVKPLRAWVELAKKEILSENPNAFLPHPVSEIPPALSEPKEKEPVLNLGAAGLPEAPAESVKATGQNTLLPCPFCGSADVTVNFYDARFNLLPPWIGMCHGCRAETANVLTEREAIELWNQRAAPSVPDGNATGALTGVSSQNPSGSPVSGASSEEPFTSSADSAIMWNPWNKVVQDHRSGRIDHDRTNQAREILGLPQWRQENAYKEATSSPIYAPASPPPFASLQPTEQDEKAFDKWAEDVDAGYTGNYLLGANHAWFAALQYARTASLQTSETQEGESDCHIVGGSSRMCERGTKSCVTAHKQEEKT